MHISVPDKFYYQKIALLGPSRVGKTSLLTSILDDSENKLQKYSLSISPHDLATRKRLDENLKNLKTLNRSRLKASLRGTEEPFEYRFLLSLEKKPLINLSIKDYPGGWFGGYDGNWEKHCDKWLSESNVLIIPVDSTPVMEATTNSKTRALPHILQIPNLESIVTEWAKTQLGKAQEKSIIVFVPIKCESYLADNGGRADFASKLFKRVRQFYDCVIAIPFKEKLKNCSIWYCPVDTYGCLDLIKSIWKEDSSIPGGYDFVAEYMFKESIIKRKGTSDVLHLVCKNLLDNAHIGIEKEIKEHHLKQNQWLENKETYKKGVFAKLLIWLMKKYAPVIGIPTPLKEDNNRKTIFVGENRLKEIQQVMGKMLREYKLERAEKIQTE